MLARARSVTPKIESSTGKVSGRKIEVLMELSAKMPSSDTPGYNVENEFSAELIGEEAKG
jgi:hypothetical protein